MRIAVMGTGGVGGYFGARLAAAGADVSFIARGAHLAAIRRDGLRVTSALGDVHVHPARATDRPADIGPVDMVMFTVKLWDTETAAEQVKPLLGPDTGVVSFQNGVDSAERIERILGPGRAIGGVSHIAAAIAAPGLIRHTGSLARLTVGEWDGSDSRRVAGFVAAAKAAGIDVVQSADIGRAIWEKFVFLAPFSGVTSLLRQPIGAVRADEDGRWLYESAVEEVVAVARAKGVALPEDQVRRVLDFSDGLPAEMKSSMLGDLERGGRLELPWLSGAVVRLGRALGVATPTHRAILAALKFAQPERMS